MAQLAGARRHLVDREVERVRAPHGVFAGDDGGRLDAEPGAVVADRIGEVGNGESDVETAHGRLLRIDGGHQSRSITLVQDGCLYWYNFYHGDEARDPEAGARRL